MLYNLPYIIYFCGKLKKVERVIICVTNDLTTDQRVHRVALTIMQKLSKEVVLVGRSTKHSVPVKRPYRTKRFKLLVNSGPLFYILFNLRLLIMLLLSRMTIIISNDLDTLPACAIAAKLKRKKLYYDSHELFTEVPELINRPVVQKIWQWTERTFVPGVDVFYTVSEPIANLYAAQYNRHVHVIRNLPVAGPFGNEVEKYEVPTLIYQGAINKGRGVELMIEVMKYLENFNLIICGKGDLYKKLKQKVHQQGSDNIFFKGHQDFMQLKKITRQSHIGLSWEENLGRNYQYALPNKLFDYIQAKIPVLVSDLQGMKSVIDEYEAGELLRSRNSEKISVQIRELFDKRHTFDSALQKAASDLCWEKEEKKLMELFNY